MSRSIKKTPILKDGGRSAKKQKTLANRTLRRKLKNPDYELSNDGQYKKEYPQYDINDYICYYSKEDAIKAYDDKSDEESFIQRHKEFPTLEDWLKDWEKQMKRK